jgi:hypothetical protein
MVLSIVSGINAISTRLFLLLEDLKTYAAFGASTILGGNSLRGTFVATPASSLMSTSLISPYAT